MFVKLFLKELSCLLKKTCITYIAIFGSALVCLCLCACASLFYTVEQEMMWCLRITGIFFFAGAILFCMFFQFFVYVRRFTSTVIGNERYLTFSVPTSLYSVVSLFRRFSCRAVGRPELCSFFYHDVSRKHRLSFVVRFRAVLLFEPDPCRVLFCLQQCRRTVSKDRFRVCFCGDKSYRYILRRRHRALCPYLRPVCF